jgi:hypothetical protein
MARVIQRWEICFVNSEFLAIKYLPVLCVQEYTACFVACFFADVRSGVILRFFFVLRVRCLGFASRMNNSWALQYFLHNFEDNSLTH